MRKLWPALTWACCSLFACPAIAQTGRADSSRAVAYAIAQYQKFLLPEKGLYTGRQYLDYKNVLDEKYHPYYRYPDFRQGSVFYDGMLYEDLPLEYDILRNAVVTWDPTRKYFIELVNEKLDWFTIAEDRFVHLRPARTTALTEGFYRPLYEGRVSVFKRETKKVMQEIEIKKVVRTTEDVPAYFIRKGDLYFEVSSKSSILKVFNDKKSELNQFIRKNSIDVFRDKDHALAVIAAQYDQLTR